jgi:histidinol-phosphatase (PHP family)
MLEAELPEYFEWIAAARAHAAGRIPVRAGLECDWLDGCENWIADLASRFDWDYLIGSVHYLGDWDFDNPKWLGPLGGKRCRCGLDALLANLRPHGGERIVRYPRPPGSGEKIQFPAGGRSCAFLRTGGGCHRRQRLRHRAQHRRLAQTVRRSLSRDGFLELACSAGVPLVISSDAHAPQEIGRDFAKAIELAKAAGYRETQLFEKRRRRSEHSPKCATIC